MKINETLYLFKEKGILDSNTYLIKEKLTVLIDPGRENYLEPRLKEMQDDGIDPEDIDLIIITHLHPDHCGATAALKEVSGAKVALHSSQREYFDVMAEESRKFLGTCSIEKFNADLVLGERLSLGTLELDIMHTPGHSPCSICFYVEVKKILICGDLVFERGVGRTDLPFGDAEELKNSIEMVSGRDTKLLLPGHGARIEGRVNLERNYKFVKAVL
ncbi:MAG: MBL fold metallo-hydrolase [Methanophagales archaeon]|nr:MBL fold metallo-hydrolase [Methanophagales archaeon]